MLTTYDLKNFADHGVTQEEVDQVLRSDVTAEFDLVPSQRGNERMMLVGFTSEGRLLELGIEFFFDEDKMYVFHADDATKTYRTEFERDIQS
jgi:uncharacterized DUF497 family protein